MKKSLGNSRGRKRNGGKGVAGLTSAVAYEFKQVRSVPTPDLSRRETDTVPSSFAKLNMRLSAELLAFIEANPKLADQLDGHIVIHIIEGVPNMHDFNQYNRRCGAKHAAERNQEVIEAVWTLKK